MLAPLLVAGLWILACGGTGPTVPVPAAVAAVRASAPTVRRIEGDLWVVGLPEHHGLSRGARMLVVGRAGARQVHRKVGIVRVLDGSYPTAVPVAVVFEVPGADFEGAGAAVIEADDVPRVHNYIGRVVERPSRIEVVIDIGLDDGVAVGMEYEVLSAAGGAPAGRVRVVDVAPGHARAQIVTPGGVSVGLWAVFAPRAHVEAAHPGVTVGVCRFTPKSAGAADLAGSYAFDFAQALIRAARRWERLDIVEIPEAVGFVTGDGHAEAREIGRRYGAQIVVWGTMECVADRGCASPRFTVVDEARLVRGVAAGPARIFGHFDQDKVGPSQTRAPLGLAQALLGLLAVEANRYRDAAFYLRRALDAEVLTGDDRWRALRDLAQVEFHLGQLESATSTARELEQGATAAGELGWAALGTGQRARILDVRGRFREALALHEDALAAFEALGRPRERAMVLADIAHVLWQLDRQDEAMALHREALGVFESVGDERARAMTLGDIARLHADAGRFEAAIGLHREQLVIYEALGDSRERAVTQSGIARAETALGNIDAALALHRAQLVVYAGLGEEVSRGITLAEIARLRAMEGAFAEALEGYRDAQAVFDEIGDRLRWAEVEVAVARLHTSLGRVDEALAAFERARQVFVSTGEIRGHADLIGELAQLQLVTGQLDRALALTEIRRKLYILVGDRGAEAAALVELARIHARADRSSAALALYREAAALYETLGDVRGRAAARGGVAEMLQRAGQIDEALALHRERLATYETLDDRHSRAVVTGDIARLRTAQGRLDEALALHRAELAVYVEEGDRRSRAIALGDIARILHDQGHREEALEMHLEELDVYGALRDHHSRVGTLVDVVWILLMLGDVSTALDLSVEGVALSRLLGHRQGLCLHEAQLAVAYVMRDEAGDASRAAKHFADAWMLAREDGDGARLEWLQALSRTFELDVAAAGEEE